LNKMDCTGAEDVLKSLRKALKGKKILGISAVAGTGLDELTHEIIKMLKNVKEEPLIEEKKAPAVQRYILENDFTVTKEDEVFRICGKKVERLFAMTNFEQPEAATRFQNILKKMGVERMLQSQGIQPGDIVLIGTEEFTYQENPTVTKKPRKSKFKSY